MLEEYLNKIVKVKVDRPKGSKHPKFDDIIYPINYGYVENTVSGDGEEIDVYILGVDKPVQDFTGRVIAIIDRLNDNESKLVAAPDKMHYSKAEIEKILEFQEKYFVHKIVMK